MSMLGYGELQNANLHLAQNRQSVSITNYITVNDTHTETTNMTENKDSSTHTHTVDESRHTTSSVDNSTTSSTTTAYGQTSWWSPTRLLRFSLGRYLIFTLALIFVSRFATSQLSYIPGVANFLAGISVFPWPILAILNIFISKPPSPPVLETPPTIDISLYDRAYAAISGQLLHGLQNIHVAYPNVAAMQPPPEVDIRPLSDLEATVQDGLYDAVSSDVSDFDALLYELSSFPASASVAWYTSLGLYGLHPYDAAIARLERFHDKLTAMIAAREASSSALAKTDVSYEPFQPICLYRNSLESLFSASQKRCADADACGASAEHTDEIICALRMSKLLCTGLDKTWEGIEEVVKKIQETETTWLQNTVHTVHEFLKAGGKGRGIAITADGIIMDNVERYKKLVLSLFFKKD